MIRLFVTLLINLSFLVSIRCERVNISVLYNASSKSYLISDSIDDTFDAFGYFDRNEDGDWHELSITMQTEISSIEDHLLYIQAMGYLEGFVTCKEINSFIYNFNHSPYAKILSDQRTITFLQSNYRWMQEASDRYYQENDYWYSIKSALTELNGLVRGFQESTCSSTTDEASILHPVLILQAWSDLPGIYSSFAEEMESMIPLLWLRKDSAFLKLLNNSIDDVIVGHTSWNDYQFLGPRIWKEYNFPLMRNGFAEHHYQIRFPSYPGLLTSCDEFYVINGYSNVLVMATSNPVLNNTIFTNIQPQNQLLTPWRVIAANQLASKGSEWSTTYQQYSYGMTSNQWMILDLKLYKNQSLTNSIAVSNVLKTVLPGFLTIYEEIPHDHVCSDITSQFITNGYFASYNIPYHLQIQQSLGYLERCETDTHYCYNTSPRAQLFQQYNSQVQNLEGGKWLIAYNSYQNDSSSEFKPCQAIACRKDLQGSSIGKCPEWKYGNLDAKVTTASAVKSKIGGKMNLHLRLGPTMDQQDVYCWSNGKTSQENYSPKGQPDCFHFAWREL